MSARVSTRQVSGITIIDVAGRVTLGGPQAALHDALGAALAGGSTKILINLAGVDYIDSSGIGALVGGARAAKSSGASLGLVNLPRRVHDLLQLTAVITLFACYDDEASAVARLA